MLGNVVMFEVINVDYRMCCFFFFRGNDGGSDVSGRIFVHSKCFLGRTGMQSGTSARIYSAGILCKASCNHPLRYMATHIFYSRSDFFM